jgi:hypothetical protein
MRPCSLHRLTRKHRSSKCSIAYALMAVGDLVGQRAQFADDADVATIGSADFEVYLDADYRLHLHL